MEMYVVALIIYFVLFVIAIIASRSFKLKTLSSFTKHNAKSTHNSVKENIIVNPEIVGAK
jgi:hypothetical protein